MPVTLLIVLAIAAAIFWASQERHDPEASRRRWRIVAAVIAVGIALWIFIAWSAQRSGPLQ